ncbi:MAG: hypothetical protein CMK64_05140 [Pseudoalteromonas sp.]|nr:hypothetical protein [Pseudoalteromonas sp.]|tara:strand:- start:36936 stop:38528 length:1593 start_codon:yes stop_codon:yes gene_type:complete
MKLKITLISSALLFAGCASIKNPEKVANKNATYQSYAQQALAYQEHTPNVYYFSQFYVPKLKTEDLKLPSWAYKKVSRKLKDKMPLSLLLDLSLQNSLINVEYREGVEKDFEITLNSEPRILNDIIKAIRANTGYKIDVQSNRIVIHKYVNQLFHVRTPGGEYKYSLGKRKESVVPQAGDDFAQSDALTETGDEFATLNGEFNPLDDYLKGVRSILGCKTNEHLQRLKSASGENVANFDVEGNLIPQKIDLSFVNECEAGSSAKKIESDNSLFVKALPSQMIEVQNFIDEKSERELRQVRINLTLVAIEKNEDTALNFDADLIDKTLMGLNKIALETTSNSSSSLIGGLGDRGSATLKHLNGTNLILQNLSKNGSILDKTFMTAMTSNNRIGKFTDATKVSLITDRPVNQTTNVGTQSGVEQKVVNSGRVFYMMPNIGTSDVVLSISTSLSSLKDIVQKGGEGTEVESPEISDREINTTVRLEPNKPKVIGGFSIDESQSLFSHTGLTGVGRSSRNREVHVVMVAEAIME